MIVIKVFSVFVTLTISFFAIFSIHMLQLKTCSKKQMPLESWMCGWEQRGGEDLPLAQSDIRV